MSRCFVIQPFDGSAFDARFDEVIAPAIKATGLEPYRVDRDPSVSIPIQDIADGIRNSVLCVADISIDNPNVWFELGYAISANKEVVMICSDARQTHFPFDVQHRSITRYKTSSPGDFEKLKLAITARIEAIMQKVEVIENVAEASNIKPVEGLKQHEIVALAAICENLDSPNDYVSVYRIQKDIENAMFTKMAATLALKILKDKGLIDQTTLFDGGDEYTGFGLTDSGWEWTIANQDKFVLRRSSFGASKGKNHLADDDIPF